MKRILIIAAATICLLAACTPKEQEKKVMARAVPERMDDFVWENNLICCRMYGEALEGNPTSPGFDVWVKLPGKLVADDWYRHYAQEGNETYYHHDHGGKDCYKVAVSLGAGASAILRGDAIRYPKTNYRSSQIIEEGPDKVVFSVSYPEWEEEDGEKIALTKTITVTPDTQFFKVEDKYTFSGEWGDSLFVIAGVFRHPALETVVGEECDDDRYMLWEHASDQSNEPEDGFIGVAVYSPETEFSGYSSEYEHGVIGKKIASGDTFTYWSGNCWSKGNVKTQEDWFKMVREFTGE